MSDLRQRFYIEDCPVRGEVVHLEETLQTILAQRKFRRAGHSNGQWRSVII